MGSVNRSVSGDVCVPWQQAGAVGSIPRGGASLGGHNNCRNLLLLDQGPGCFTDMQGTYQICNIPYEGRCQISFGNASIHCQTNIK